MVIRIQAILQRATSLGFTKMTDYKFKIYHNNQWRTIKRPRYYNGTNWLEARAIYIYSNNDWRQVYQVVTSPNITTQPTNQSGSVSAPTITTQPTNQSGDVNTTATFTITVADPFFGTRSYQWQRDSGAGFVNVTTGSGGTTNTYTTETLTAGMSGYKYRCVATITGGIGGATLSLVANGNGTLSYQWYKSNGDALNLEIYSYLTTQVTGDYYCKVTNTRNDEGITVQSNTATATWTNTSSLNSNEATLTVTGVDVTTRDDNNPTFSGTNASNVDYSKTRDISFGDTTTYGYVGANGSSTYNGDVTCHFASASITSGTLYLEAGLFATSSDWAEVGASATLEYSTDNGSTWTEVVSTSNQEQDTTATSYEVSLGAIDMADLQVRYSGEGGVAGEYGEYSASAHIKMYDIYVIYTPV